MWRTHPRKLAFGAGQLIDVEVNQLDVSDEKADEIWRDAYADLKARITEITSWRTGTMYVDWRADEVDSPSERFDEKFVSRVADVRLVVDSGVAMWGDRDLEELAELTAPFVRRFRDEMIAAKEADNEERYFAIFEDLVSQTHPPGPELEDALDEYRQRRERWPKTPPER